MKIVGDIGGARRRVRRLDFRDESFFVGARWQRAVDSRPLRAAIARHVNRAIVGARPQHRGVDGRLRQREQRAVTVIALRDRRVGLVLLRAQVGADHRAAVTHFAVGDRRTDLATKHIVGADVQDARIR
jgi:hypothetical protein